jgi:hypothetical protein|tara:strand:- start:1722 stop:1901 length:180 start_codon:yes stop_codon:yes gene_type:complete
MKEEGEEVIEKLEGKVEDIVKEVLEEYFKKKEELDEESFQKWLEIYSPSKIDPEELSKL